MYGFSEVYPNNIYDNVEIPTNCLINAIKQLNSENDALINRKIELFYELDLIDSSASFIFSINGNVLNEEECLLLLQVTSIY